MSTILDRIVAQRRKDVEVAKANLALPELERQAGEAPTPMDIVGRLRAEGDMALIAEVKRASPSKGDIAPGIDAAEQALAYARAGAAGISILTEPTWFKGSLDDLASARAALEQLDDKRPAVLRKDFIFDPYQVYEARRSGADSLLLIVAILDDSALAELLALSRELGMEPLVEVNNSEEMERAMGVGTRLVATSATSMSTWVRQSAWQHSPGKTCSSPPSAAFRAMKTLNDFEPRAPGRYWWEKR